MILIRQSRNGKRDRICNSRCYNAKHPNCVCICSGTNHSVGLQKAMGQSAKVTEAIAQETGATPVKVLLL